MASFARDKSSPRKSGPCSKGAESTLGPVSEADLKIENFGEGLQRRGIAIQRSCRDNSRSPIGTPVRKSSASEGSVGENLKEEGGVMANEVNFLEGFRLEIPFINSRKDKLVALVYAGDGKFVLEKKGDYEKLQRATYLFNNLEKSDFSVEEYGAWVDLVKKSLEIEGVENFREKTIEWEKILGDQTKEIGELQAKLDAVSISQKEYQKKQETLDETTLAHQEQNVKNFGILNRLVAQLASTQTQKTYAGFCKLLQNKSEFDVLLKKVDTGLRTVLNLSSAKHNLRKWSCLTGLRDHRLSIIKQEKTFAIINSSQTGKMLSA
jgi:hypothetical protein